MFCVVSLQQQIYSTMEHPLIILNSEQLQTIIQDSISKAVSQLPTPEKQPEQVRYCSINETMQILKVSRPTLWKQTKNGTLKGYKFGKRVLYKVNELDEATRQMNFEPKR